MSKDIKARLFVFAVSVAALVGTLTAGIVEFVRKGFSLDLTLGVTTTAIIAVLSWGSYRKARRRAAL